MKMGEYPENRLVHTHFVCPLVYYFCTEMNPHMSLDPRTMMMQDLSRCENNIKTKLRAYGSYGQEEAIRRVNLPKGHPEQINHRDKDMLSGIEFQFFRYYTLLIRGMSIPWDSYKRQSKNMWLLPGEQEALWVGYDDVYCFCRADKPRLRHPTWRR